MQLSVGSKWTDHEGNTFIIDAVTNNDAEVWVAYHKQNTDTHYRCLAEAFTYRFTLLTQ